MANLLYWGTLKGGGGITVINKKKQKKRSKGCGTCQMVSQKGKNTAEYNKQSKT
jgi:hypothetical protein